MYMNKNNILSREDLIISEENTIEFVLNENYNNLFVINRSDMEEIFEKTFDKFWNTSNKGIVEDQAAIMEHIRHVIRGIYWSNPDLKMADI